MTRKYTLFAVIDERDAILCTAGTEALAIYKSVTAAKRDGWFFDKDSTVCIVKLVANAEGIS